jgi:hypothetical protein
MYITSEYINCEVDIKTAEINRKARQLIVRKVQASLVNDNLNYCNSSNG